jgi:hypothetical protein
VAQGDTTSLTAAGIDEEGVGLDCGGDEGVPSSIGREERAEAGGVDGEAEEERLAEQVAQAALTERRAGPRAPDGHGVRMWWRARWRGCSGGLGPRSGGGGRGATSRAYAYLTSLLELNLHVHCWRRFFSQTLLTGTYFEFCITLLTIALGYLQRYLHFFLTHSPF